MSVPMHPLTGSPPLGVPPLLLAGVTVLAAAVVLSTVQARPRPDDGAEVAGVRRSFAAAATRALTAAVLLGLLAVARWGPEPEPENLASVVAAHVLWPGLLLGAAAAGLAYRRWTDPWYAGRVEPPPGVAETAGPAVWPALVAAVALAVGLAEAAVLTPPRWLATAGTAYVIVVAAGVLAVGRDWLERAELFGLLARWTGAVRTRATTWQPPSGAAAVLGAVLGGVLFARARRAPVWSDVALSPNGVTWSRLAAAAAALLGAALALAASRWAGRRGAPGSVETALVPLVVGAAVATELRRTLVALQLVPQLVADPFGRGWRLLGRFSGARVVDVNPWGTAVQQALAWAVLTVAAVAAAWVVARRVDGVRARDPAAFVLYVTAGLAALLAMAR